jgi:hypothetical protein
MVFSIQRDGVFHIAILPPHRFFSPGIYSESPPAKKGRNIAKQEVIIFGDGDHLGTKTIKNPKKLPQITRSQIAETVDI